MTSSTGMQVLDARKDFSRARAACVDVIPLASIVRTVDASRHFNARFRPAAAGRREIDAWVL